MNWLEGSVNATYMGVAKSHSTRIPNMCRVHLNYCVGMPCPCGFHALFSFYGLAYLQSKAAAYCFKPIFFWHIMEDTATKHSKQ